MSKKNNGVLYVKYKDDKEAKTGEVLRFIFIKTLNTMGS